MPRQVKCPRCATANTVADGERPVCINCGFGAPAGSTPGQGGMPGPPVGGYPASQAMHGMVMGGVKRPGIVTAAAVLGIILAGLVILGGVLIAAIGGTIAAMFVGTEFSEIGALGTAIFVIVGLIVVAVGGLQLVASLFILKGKNWARILQTVLSALGILNGVTDLPNGLLGLAINVFIIVALFVPAANAFFKGRHPMQGAMAYPSP